MGASCRDVEEKARQHRVDRDAEARDRPVPSRIKERADAIVEGQLREKSAKKGGEDTDDEVKLVGRPDWQ